jgi:hypothetical protein
MKKRTSSLCARVVTKQLIDGNPRAVNQKWCHGVLQRNWPIFGRAWESWCHNTLARSLRLLRLLHVKGIIIANGLSAQLIGH